MTEKILKVLVAVENTLPAFDRLFTYTVPQSFANAAKPGVRVLVPFGRASKSRWGIIVRVEPLTEASSEGSEFKQLQDIPDATRYLDDEAIALSLWIKEQTFSTYYDALRLALPKGLQLKKKVKVAEPKEEASQTFCPKAEIVLNEEQALAFGEIKKLSLTQKANTALLYGVTGSGKTSVYLKLIDELIKEERGVILMVPEIALTTQLITTLSSRYSSLVAIFHSRLSQGERLTQWHRVKSGEAKIAVGTRSAVFAPVQGLGMIIIDEEQEAAYKSETSPYYSTREVASYRCGYHQCMLLLGSATPSVESYSKAISGKYSLSTLKKRYNESGLPSVAVVDMLAERLSGNSSTFSRLLIDELETVLREKRQAILLLNRRGYNTIVCCRSCKQAISCKKCSVPAVYHISTGRLHCHYCGETYAFPENCPSCGETKLISLGCGTQRAQEELEFILPAARILRMDADTTGKKHDFDTLLHQFGEGEYDIMLGTKMVAKGLDFPNVSLVGVLNADQALYAEDFRGYERAFSLLTQVIGRAGRSSFAGNAVIQTFTPDNYIVQLACEQDYLSFFDSEVKLRRRLEYPPFSDICAISFFSTEEERAKAAAYEFSRKLAAIAREGYPKIFLRILEPAKYAIFKLNHKYRYRLIVKCRFDGSFQNLINQTLESWYLNTQFSKVGVWVAMNPEYL